MVERAKLGAEPSSADDQRLGHQCLMVALENEVHGEVRASERRDDALHRVHVATTDRPGRRP